MKTLERTLKKSIKAALRYFPVLTITGPRQSGKTTLCREMFPSLPYANLESPTVREAAMQDPEAFLGEHSQGMVIDEAHHFPELFSYIQVAVDENPKRRYVLTGSSNFSLLEQVTQSLAGRVAIFSLLPFALGELGVRAGKVSTDEWILRGGYPALWSKKTPIQLFFTNYYGTYIERDVRQIVNVKDLRAFQTFVRLVAGRIGSECNANALAGEVGVASNTIKHWLGILEASYIVFLLPPYFENIGKRLIKSPKIYFHDTGLACFLLGISKPEQLASHPLRGHLFENMVVSGALKSRFNAGKTSNLFFYRDRSQVEVDLIAEEAGKLELFEIKSSQTFHADFFKGIHALKETLQDRILRAALIYDGDLERKGGKERIYNWRTAPICN
jgi:predicted AAA+ superfamily ATPase